MKLLFDTHTFIWWDSDPSRISQAALAALRDPANTIWFSVVNVWEIVIKSRLGKLPLRLPVSQVAGLDVTLAHTLAVEGLPPVHKDPFDRLLVAQANVEGAEFVTADPIFAHYPVRVLW